MRHGLPVINTTPALPLVTTTHAFAQASPAPRYIYIILYAHTSSEEKPCIHVTQASWDRSHAENEIRRSMEELINPARDSLEVAWENCCCEDWHLVERKMKRAGTGEPANRPRNGMVRLRGRTWGQPCNQFEGRHYRHGE
jgi:hypothetical protein